MIRQNLHTHTVFDDGKNTSASVKTKPNAKAMAITLIHTFFLVAICSEHNFIFILDRKSVV